MTTDQIKSALAVAQRCQRNWDLTKTIPQEDLDLLKFSVINSPTKQNEEYYSVIFITDRNLINSIYQTTNFNSNTVLNVGDYTRNPQTLANLLVAFCKRVPESLRKNKADYSTAAVTEDRDMSIGIVSGQLAYTAALLGYKTGFCKCFDSVTVSNLVGEPTVLLLGIGYPDTTKLRTEHQLIKMKFNSFDKPISVKEISTNGTTVIRRNGTQTIGSFNFHLKYFAPGTFGYYQLKGMGWMKQCGLTDNEIINIRTQMQNLASRNNVSFGDSTINETENSLDYIFYSNDKNSLQQFKTGMILSPIIQNFHSVLADQGWFIE